MSINSLYSKLSTLVETKSLLRQAIIDKGVPVRKDRDTFRDYVTKINNIVQESPHGKNAPYIDDSLVFCEDYSEIQASKLDLASDSSILDMECPFTVELSFVLDSSVELTQSFETFIDFSFVRIGAQRVSDQQLYLMYGEHLPSDPSFWSYTLWLTDNSNPTSDCILPKDQVVTITCVRYSDHALIYKNGELIITSEESFTELFDTAFSIYRPFDTDAAGYHSVINTTINNVRIYNKALNENEIYYNYSIDLLNNGNTQYLNTNHIKSGLVYGINPILPLTGINSHDDISNYNNHFDNLSIPISLQNGFTIEWRGSISDIMSNDNEPYDYTGRLFTFKNSNGTDTFEVCAIIDSEDTDIFDIGFKASDEYLIDSEDWLEVFSDTLPSIKFSSDFTLSITVSSTAVNVYINGVFEASSSTYQNEFTNANLWKILYLFTNSLESPLQGTDGFLYSLRIYNRVLNEYEINYNYKVDTRSGIKNPDPLYGKAILGELGNMTLNASGVIIPKAFDCSKPFEIVSCFKMKSDESENDKKFALFGSSDVSNYSAYPSIEIRPYTNKLWVGVSINPNNWTYTQEVDLSDIPIVYDNNVLNWIKMDYDGDKIYLSHSIDCLSWTRFHTITGIVPYNPVTNDYTLIFGAKLQNSDLTYTYKSDGETSFSFMNSWVKSCNKTIWGREIMGQELYTNNSTVLVPNGDVRYNAGSFIAYSNLDMSDDFEVVVCLAIDKTAMTSSQTYYLAGGITSSTSNFRIYATYYNIGYQIFYGTHTVAEDDVSWEDTVSNFIYNEGVQNFLKLKKHDGKVSFYHSLDAINWSLLNEVEIDSETFTNLQDDGIRFGNAGSDTSTALPMTDTSFINLHNSYVKVNGEIVWGREIREKAQVYAPEIKRETVLYQPNIDTYDPIDSYTPIDNLGEGNCVIPISDIGKYQNYLTFNKVYNSKLVIPMNPFAYDITNLSFTINFPSPRNNGWNSILGFNAKKMYVNVSDDDMLSENFIYLSLVTTDNVSDDDKSLRLSVGNVNEIIRTNDELVYKTTHDGSSNYNNSPSVAQIFFNKTEFPLSGWNSDKKIDFIFNNIHNTLTVMINNIEAVVLEFNNTIPYQFLPISATFGFFDDGRVDSPSTISMYMKDIVCKIEGSVSKGMIEEVEGGCSADMFDEIDCTPSEYYSLESYDDHRVYNVNYQDGTIRRFLGDEEIGIVRPEPKYNVVSNFYGEYSPMFPTSVNVCYKILNTHTNFDTSKTFDIIIAFKLTSSSTHNNAYCLFGTAYYYKYYNYPTCEITTDNSVWFALNTPSTSNTWPSGIQLSVGLNHNLMEFGKINYYKFSYVRDAQTIAIYHSLDGEAWTIVASKDITSALNGETLYNDTTYDFCIGGNALSSGIAFPSDDDNHICIDKCKIISNGNIIFGWDSKKVLTGEAIIEEPTVYEIDCTSEVYNSLPLHDTHTIYNVLNQDDSVNKYLGEDLIGGTVDNLGEIVPKNYENETRIFEDRNIIYETKCTSTKYNSMSNHSENVLYSVIQPDNKVYKYLGDHQVGVDKTDIGSIDITNSTDKYIKTSMLIDQTKDFEFVICFTIPTGNRSYNIAGNPDMLGIGAIVSNNSEDNTKAQGGFQFFYNTGGWDHRIGLNACPSAALIADGVTKNYYKLQRKGNYLYASYSIDGKNFILETTYEVPTGQTFTTEEPIYLGNVYPGYGEYSLNLLSFCLSECYLKQNGQIVFGNDFKPVNFAGENINTNEYAVPKSDITILKSIKSTGNSVIPTNIIPDYDWSVFLDAKFENPHSTRDGDIVFGILRSDEHFFIAMQQGPGWASYTAISGYTAQSGDTYSIGDTTSITRNLGIRQCCIMRRGTNKKCSFGDLSFEMTVKTTDSVPYKPITIMGTIDESTETLNPYDHYDATLYGIQIMDASDKLIHNFVPALSNISKRTGMYDLITETFYQSDKNFDDFEKEFIYDNTSISNYFDDIVAPVTFLKSVKSVGNSVVHTDIVLDFSWEVSMLLMFSGEYRSSSPTDCFFGVQGADPWWLAAYNNNNINVFIGFDYTKQAASMSASGWNDHVTFLRMKRDELCIYGNKTSSIPTAISGDPHDFGASFFGVSFNNTNDGKFAYYDMTIYDVEIFNSEKELIHKLVPAENNATRRGGLYDVITNKFYPAKYDDLIKEYGSNATRSPYNVYRILNPREYNQNGIVLSLFDFTNNEDYYTYTLPIASSEGFTFEINLSFTAFENRSSICPAKEQLLFDSRIDSSDRYSIRIRYISEGQYAIQNNKNSTFNTSTRYVSDNEVHTYTLMVCANGDTKVYVDGELWDTINSTNIGALYREFYLFTSYDKADGWTFYPSYRTVNRLMIYNRALSEQEILENRKADIINFGE